jgi:thiamine biosynthesis lipoprotein
MSVHELTFPCMGSETRLLLEGPGAAAAADDARAWLEDFDRRLSRFRPDSELCALNADPRPAPRASRLLRAAAGAGLWAARRTGGLVDPTVLPALRRAGYTRSLAGVAPLPLAQALPDAPPRRPARPARAARWRLVHVDDVAGTIRRPPGVELDTGGTGKGLAADAVAHRLRALPRVAVDCGGDVRVGGAGAAAGPFAVEVRHPLTGECAHELLLGAGAIATSGIDARVWRRPDGTPAHHLIDPSSGEPAWTGLVGATALGASALEAETLAKAALLSGALGARRLLGEHGGLLFHEDGGVELAGPVRPRPVVRLRRPGRQAA